MFRTRLAQDNWKSKYQYGDESPLETFQRVAQHVASVEEDPAKWEESFLRTLVKFDPLDNPVGLKATFGGRITANAGTHFHGVTLMNCFINGPVADATILYHRRIPGTNVEIPVLIQTQGTPDNLSNIMLSLLEQAETLKSEGGYGMNFGFIRPRGSVIEGVGIKHPGVVHYLDIWDTVADVIVMGDNDGYRDTLTNYLVDEGSAPTKLKKMARKGAQMAVLPVWHPDIEEYVRAKQEPGRLTKFNTSVLMDDAFLRAVQQDGLYNLHFNGAVVKRVKARDLYDLIMHSTYNRAEPGVLFYDNMQRNNPLAYLGPVDATNPCGEIPGNPATSTVCLLGSLNLTQYVTKKRGFDWETYQEDICTFTRMMDNINDLSFMSLPQYRWAMQSIRQFGMGNNGLGSALYMRGIPYNSPKALQFTEAVSWLKEEMTWKSSALLAQEKGTFPAYSEQFLETEWFTDYTTISEETKELIRQHGVRNGKTTTNPPLGNSSVICDNVSNGIEPVFAHSYTRTYVVPSWPDGLTRENVKTTLTETKAGDATVWKGTYQGTDYLYEPHNRGLCATEVVEDYGYRWVKEHFPDDFGDGKAPDYMVTTADLTIWDHLNIQEIVQRHCNQSISKTANLPPDYPFDDFKDLYLEAWKRGLVGFTTYREGSMEAVLAQVGEAKFSRGPGIISRDIKLPEKFLNGPTQIIRREGQKFYFHFSYLPEDTQQIFPVALWIETNHEGTIRQANAAVDTLLCLLKDTGVDEGLIRDHQTKLSNNPPHMRLGKMISMALRHNIPIPNIVASLDRVPEVYVTDLLFATKKFLAAQIEDGTPVQGISCAACSGGQVVFESGCTKCLDCGASNCG